jgi:hypothetical protein
MPARTFLSTARQTNFADGRAQIKEVIHADIVFFKPAFAILKQFSKQAAGKFLWFRRK